MNTSLDYRVGPSRMYVPLSRQLAAQGLTSFRFDPTGVGDHLGPHSRDAAEAYSDSRLADATVVLDFLQSHGVADRFILVGLCSGACIAFHTAVRDERVVGTVLINPQTFTWHPGDSLEMKIRGSFGSTQYYRQTLRNFATWKRAFSGQVNVMGIGRTLAKRLGARVLGVAIRAIPTPLSSRDPVELAFQTLFERGSHVLIMFDEYDGGRDVLDGHVGKNGGSLRRNTGFRLEIVRGADHTFSRAQDRRALSAMLCAQLDSWNSGYVDASASGVGQQ